MKDPHVSDVDLMMHVDGELPAGDSQRLDAQLVGGSDVPSSAGRTKVAALRELGELVRGHIELATDEAEPKLAGMWHELSKRLDNEAAPATPARQAEPRGLGTWILQWFERYRGHVLTGTLSAGAVAALALLLRPSPVATPEPVAAPLRPQLTPTLVSAPPEIEALDVPNGTGTVLTLEDEDGAAAIVWVTPEDVEEL